MYYSKALCWTTIASLLSQAAGLACTSCQPLNLQRRAEGPEFSYLGLTGPVDWNQFAPACGNGKVQSPINLVSTMETSDHGDKADYPDIGAHGYNFTNNGHTVELYYKGPCAWLGGVEYELQRFHFHTPSEHRLNNQWYSLEIHFVHQAKKDPSKLAVVGIFVDVNEKNRSDPFMTRLAKLVKSIKTKGQTVVATHVPLRSVRSAITHSKKYTYGGSLTTPPCSEGVTWFVSNTILDVSVADLNAFRNILGYNARNLQADPGNTNVVEYAAQFL